jgi:hypothetical protein
MRCWAGLPRKHRRRVLHTILRYTEPDLPEVVYAPQLSSAVYLNRPTETDFYRQVFEQACLLADSAWDTPDLLKAILEDLEQMVQPIRASRGRGTVTRDTVLCACRVAILVVRWCRGDHSACGVSPER